MADDGRQPRPSKSTASVPALLKQFILTDMPLAQMVTMVVIIAGDIMFSYTVSWNSIPGSACSYFAGQ